MRCLETSKIQRKSSVDYDRTGVRVREEPEWCFTTVWGGEGRLGVLRVDTLRPDLFRIGRKCLGKEG